MQLFSVFRRLSGYKAAALTRVSAGFFPAWVFLHRLVGVANINCSCIKLWPIFRICSFHSPDLSKLVQFFFVFRRLSGDKAAALTRVSAGLRMSLEHRHGQKINIPSSRVFVF